MLNYSKFLHFSYSFVYISTHPHFDVYQRFSRHHVLTKINFIIGRSRCYHTHILPFHLTSDLGPPIRRLSAISEPLRRLTDSLRNCQWFCIIPKTRVQFLLRRVTTDTFCSRTISGPIKLLTACCFCSRVSTYVNCHFTSNPIWPPCYPSKLAHTSIATSSCHIWAWPMTSC